MKNLDKLIKRAINDQIEKVIVPEGRALIATCNQMGEVRKEYGCFLAESGILRNPNASIFFKYFSAGEDKECALFRIIVLTEFARIKGMDL